MTDYSSRIDSVTTKALMTTRSLSADKLTWSPDDEQWSIAQILDHVIVLNSSYFPLFESLSNGQYKAPFIAKFRFLATFFGKFILKSVQPEEPRKTKTMDIWQPRGHTDTAGILDRFASHQQELLDHLKTMDGVVDGNTIINSPANRNIVYRLDTAIDIIITHEERHLLQIIEIAQSISN